MTTDASPVPADLSLADFRTLARERLSPGPSNIVYDNRGEKLWGEANSSSPIEDAADFVARMSARCAAVLVPIVARDGLTVLLTRRTEELPNHAGQIAFPGGKLEPGDDNAVAAAFREAREEIGLQASFIEPLGFLDNVLTRSGFFVVPVVALIKPGFALTPDAREVADAFEVPLAFLMNPLNHQTHQRDLNGAMRRFYAMPYGERFIWGLTAGMIKNLYERLFAK